MELSLQNTFQYPNGAYREAREGPLFSGTVMIRSNVYKLKKGKFGLDTRQKFFAVRMMRLWHKLIHEAVDTPTLEMFKSRLDKVWSNQL